MLKLNMPNHEQIDTWLSIHDPEKHQLLSKFSKTPQHKFLVGINNNPAVSGSAGTGDQIEQAKGFDTQFQDIVKNTQGKLTPNQYQTALDLFKKNPISGCTSVLTIARSSSGFNPLLNDVSDQAPKFKQYLENINKAPFFDIPFSATTTIKQTAQDYNLLIDDIVNLYEGIINEDKVNIAKSLRQMAAAATSRKETQQSQTLFAQNTIQASKNNVDVYIYYSSVVMVMTDDKSSSFQAEYQILQARLRFLVEFWPIYAEKVMNVNYTCIDDWLTNMDTPLGKAGGGKFCLSQ